MVDGLGTGRGRLPMRPPVGTCGHPHVRCGHDFAH